jgi:hypothetical protein
LGLSDLSTRIEKAEKLSAAGGRSSFPSLKMKFFGMEVGLSERTYAAKIE